MTLPESASKILATMHSIAVVGASPNPARDSHRIFRYLQAAGFEVVPVNPMVSEVAGSPTVADLRTLSGRVDTVVVFRRSEEVPPIVDDAIAAGAANLWMQLGVHHESARARAVAAGVTVVMDRCIMVDHRAQQR